MPSAGVDLPESTIDPPVVAHTIKDPIHDCIPVSLKLKSFIDTPQYQRLRDIKQLGVSYTVWPGASHNRFEHGLGVAYLGRILGAHLQKNQPELKITDRDVECVEIAGLCHDLGHGPWSHFWDGMFIPRAMKDSEWKHEDASEMMFDYLVEDNNISIEPDDSRFIKALIAGNPSKCSPDEKSFLFDIIANKRNGLDVDKFDYIQRDSYMIGEPTRISLRRIIYSARVLNDQICYDIKDANQLYEICATRFKLHKIVYNHKVAKAIEYMMLDGLLSANKYLHFAEDVKNPHKYLYLNDSLVLRIESSNEQELEEARGIIRRIRVRDLYKCVDYKVINWPHREMFRENVTSERIVEEAKKAAEELPKDSPIRGNRDRGRDENDDIIDYQSLTPNDVIVDFSIMHYGMKEKNPLDSIEFYSKRRPKVSAKAERGDYSNLMPEFFAEVLLRVYTKNAEFFGIIQAGYRAVLGQLSMMSEDGAFIDSFPLPFILNGDHTGTPAVTEPPSTPRVFSRNPSSTFATAQFSNNSFTTVSPTFKCASPTGAHKKPRSRKRVRGDEDASASDGGAGASGRGPPKKKSKE
ncbi:hypothetical protein AX15_007020 [Amanita polypyramis BW_CC]|nr:hypothetical protein AX15_007020 [Amanita polypyramis BW_CC]